MQPFVDALATLLDRFSVATLSLVDADARPRTRPLRTVPARFNGHVWLRAGSDPDLRAEIGRGTEVSVTYGSAEAGQYVTIYGWAIVLQEPAYNDVSAVRRVKSALICVNAHAAEMWDVGAEAGPRIIAFSHPQPSAADESGSHSRALPAGRGLRLATLDASL